ncbi:MAG TPA: 4'-phosphopantetheinyl transferase superfamily protein [Coleofasciculaceae cyanobacterium]|jgi:4'-phosphopantetheinyl transferase
MHVLMPEWRLPPENLVLLPHEIHIWQAPLHQPTAQVEQLTQLLSEDEQARAARLRRERDRLQFIISRGLLRVVLGRYLAIAPSEVEFGYGAYGKPFVIKSPELQFNASHTHELALYAIGRDRPVGIDVEYTRRPLADMEQLTQRFFSKREHATLLALPAHQRVKAFFRGWTCKEAYLKAIGIGLSQLEQVEVALTPDMPAKLILATEALPPEAKENSGGNAGKIPPAQWWLCTLEPQPDYVAALVGAIAEANSVPHLHYWQAKI